MSEFDMTCTACGAPVDCTTRHLTVVRQYERHDPPGHVTEIGYSTVAEVYHPACVPAAIDPALAEATS